MANFEYWGNTGNKGTSVNDTFRIGGGNPSATYHNGWIDGGRGKDELVISGTKNDWNLSRSGSTHFLSTEVAGIFGPQDLTIQLQNVEKVRFFDGSFDLTRNHSGSSSSNANNRGSLTQSSQTNNVSISVDNSVTSNGNGTTNASQSNSVNVDVSGSGANVKVNGKNHKLSGKEKSNDLNEIFGGKKGDSLIGSQKGDFLWGDKGNDEIFGGAGGDLIVGGKGADMIRGGAGKDWFGVSKKFGKGKRNFDIIEDFEVGEDVLMVEGNRKGLWIDNYKGDAILVNGKNDVIAWINDAGGQLDWGTGGDSDLIM